MGRGKRGATGTPMVLHRIKRRRKRTGRSKREKPISPESTVIYDADLGIGEIPPNLKDREA
jgi:hypothetical protein